MNADSLLQTVARLFALLHERQVEYVLVGGVAMLQYVEGRNTEDIDLIMALSSLKKLPEIEVTSQDMYFARGKFDELQIDILLTHNPLFDRVRERYATLQRFVERDIPCATVEGLLLLKLYALPSLYRQGNFARVGLYENDIATLMHDYQPQLDPLFDELAHHLSDTDLAEVRNIVAEIRQRIERFGKGFDERK
jgi:predicted nucleotidyltransferase